MKGLMPCKPSPLLLLMSTTLAAITMDQDDIMVWIKCLHYQCLCISVILILLVFAYIYICLPSAYAYLFMLIVSYDCLCCLCLFTYLLMGYNISEGIFCWTMKYGRKGSG
jgi:hypothetical protein